MIEGGHLFFATKNGTLDDEQHLAEMVSLLGPPPPEFLRSDKGRQFWDEEGKINFPSVSILKIYIILQAIGRAL
jgi:hypothetical protein